MTKNELQELINESVITAINEQNYENSINELVEATEYLEDCLYEEYCLFEVAEILCEGELIQKYRDQLKKIDDNIANEKKWLKHNKDHMKHNKKIANQYKGSSTIDNITDLMKHDCHKGEKLVKDPEYYKYVLNKKVKTRENSYNEYKKSVNARKKTIRNLKDERKQLLADIKKEAEEKRNNLGKKNPNSIGAKLDRINEPTTREKMEKSVKDTPLGLPGHVASLDKAETKVQDMKSPEVKKDIVDTVTTQIPDNATKAEATDKALDAVNNKLDSNKFEKKGNKIVAVFKNPDGTVNKKAVGIAALATAVAGSIAAAAIVHKKKKKAEEAKKKLEENKNKEKE